MEITYCNLCGADETQVWMNLTDRFSGQQFQLVKCQNCGLIYLSPRPSRLELIDFYPENYEAYQPDKDEMSTTEAWHASHMWEMQLKYIQRYRSNPGRLLDIGCATGEFISTARNHGWIVQGIEINEQSAQMARSRYQLDVLTGTLDNFEDRENYFDVISLWDVLEHLPDPKETLMHCHKLLRKNGIIVFSIPNLKSFDRYLFGSYWIGWDTPRHFTLFTLKTLQQVLEHSGFSIIGKKCFLGGKGTFLLSLGNIPALKPNYKHIKKYYPIFSAFLWPYRQFSYLIGRGPILAVAANKVENV